MDIRTLLTETKPFPQKRKADALSPVRLPDSAPSTSMEAPSLKRSVTIPSYSYIPPPSSSTNEAKKVTFTLGDSISSPGPRSFNLTISPTDPPNAITSTVKDFFALHNCGVSFTDEHGCILIITPNNLTDDMEVIVNQTSLADGENKHKKRRKPTLSSRKKSRKVNMEKDIPETDVEISDSHELHERKEKSFSSDVSIENILDSSRRRLSKFSSEVSSFVLMLI
jgi:hypothetical protein